MFFFRHSCVCHLSSFVYATLLLKNSTITYYFYLFVAFCLFSFSFTNIFVGDMRVPCCLFRTLILYVLTVLSLSTSVCLFGWFFFSFSIFLFFLRVPFFSKINKKEENKLERSIQDCLYFFFLCQCYTVYV
jgi:hypothetical protein